ncbi:MAG: hypothetical protein ACRDRT_05965, partial [Pseudonocardiaceae bacterium]
GVQPSGLHGALRNYGPGGVMLSEHNEWVNGANSVAECTPVGAGWEDTSGRRLRRDRKHWAQQGLDPSRDPSLECPRCPQGHLRWYIGTLFCDYCAEEFYVTDLSTKPRGTGSRLGVDPAHYGGVMSVRKAIEIAHHAKVRGW